MLNTAGLSLDQAPPIRVPFAFFLAAPLFGLLAGGLLLWQGGLVLATRWSAPALSVTHLLALGFVTQILCGALLQILPVLAGAPVPRVAWVGPLVQIPLATGTLALSLGLLRGDPDWLTAGGALLTAALTVLVAATGLALSRATGVPRTLAAMRLGLVALPITLLLGLLLIAALSIGLRLPGFADWVNLHAAWGLLGWIALLVMGVGYQVVPMFHVTPSYPDWLARRAAPLTAAALVLGSLTTAMGAGAATAWILGLAAVPFVVFAVVTLDLQRRRERPRLDTTLLHWRSAMASVLLAGALLLAGGPPEIIGVLALIGLGVGLPSGMLFKIVPFLCWFHLQHRQVATRRFDVRIPHMHGFIPETASRIQFWLHLTALAALVSAATLLALVSAVPPSFGSGWARLVGDWLARGGGLALLLSSGLLGGLLLGAALKFRETRRRL